MRLLEQVFLPGACRRFAGVLALAGLAAWAATLAGCDAERIAKLEEGVATEDDVKRQFGEPAAVVTEGDGSRTFEYPRQPEGWSNYFITIGPDGKMSRLRQVLNENNFAKVQPGMDKAELRRLLGRPAKTQTYALKKEEEWDWRWRTPQQVAMVFTAVLDENGKVVRSGSVEDPRTASPGGK
jgi:hypothetical protein